jgi:hypothetical protein
MLNIVNMIPASMSGETNQDSEPNIAVNPENLLDMVATAFTPAPLGGTNAPLYVSTDGGNTWSLNQIVPGNGFVGTDDITVAFATTGGMLYAGTLNGSTGKMNILRTSSFASSTVMTTLVDRASEDQPWVVAGSVVASGVSHDRVFVGNEDGNQPGGQTATVDVSQDAATAPAPSGFAPIQLEHRTTVVIPSLGRGKDGPPIRTALHSDGTVYCAFQRWASGTFPSLNTDIVVTRDDNWGAGVPPFNALVDSGDGVVGQRVATNRFISFNAIMGQERLGSDLAIAVDPNNSKTVYIAWCDRVGGASGTDWTVHVSRSTDRGQTWSGDLRTITNVKNPALAINSGGSLGFLYQQFTGTTWDTKLELTSDGWASVVTPLVLQTVTSATPVRTFLPYIGDYVRLIAVGANFYGVFCGNNTPNMANFPNGVTYQRAADWSTQTLLSTDGVTHVTASIDPFFFRWSAGIAPRGPIIARGPISRSPIITRGPIISRSPIISRGPIFPQPPSPIIPVAPVNPGPVAAKKTKVVRDIDL